MFFSVNSVQLPHHKLLTAQHQIPTHCQYSRIVIDFWWTAWHSSKTLHNSL